MEDPHLLPMQRISKLLAISDNNKKVKILMERFFPQLALVNLNNIIGKTLVTCLRVNSDIITKEMAKTISCLLNNIILRLNKIPNKALKTCKLLIILWLVDIAKAYFIIGYYLRLRKAIIIVILRKKGKKNYLLLGSYQFIALKNTLSKILERVIAECMADIAEKHILLL